jgi:hypothetical protein
MTFILHHVVRARHLGAHRVRLCFDDGVVGDVDLGPFLDGPVFEPLQDPAYFAEFGVKNTLVWPNGADFAPEFLRNQISPLIADDHATDGDWRDAPPEMEPGPFEVSRFLGVTVSMGIPWLASGSVLVQSEAHSAKVEIESGKRIGQLPAQRFRAFEAWRLLRLEDLRRNVARLERGEEALPIEPLD